MSYVTMISLLFEVILIALLQHYYFDNSNDTDQLVSAYHCIQSYISKIPKEVIAY